MAKLIAAAIKFYPKDSKYPQIVCGKRHCDCYQWMFKHGIEYDKMTQTQGFMTETNEFVDRYEAYWIAVEEDQILPDAVAAYMDKPIDMAIPLFSEDVW